MDDIERLLQSFASGGELAVVVFTQDPETLRGELESRTDLRVVDATHRVPLQSGTIYLADTESHVAAANGALEVRTSAERMAQNEEFLAMLGHELRNPLAAIQSTADLLRLLHPDDLELQTAQGVLERQSAQMSRLVEGLLDVSRIVRGQMELDKRRLDLVQLLRDVLQERAIYILDRGLELRSELPSDPILFEGDPERLAQVFDAILTNAANFTQPPGTVTIAVGMTEGRATVTIRDSGMGIDQSVRERIFEPFQQAPQGLARTVGGLGLGLALARGIVEMHGGSIAVRSAGLDRGAEFDIQLPLVETEQAAPEPSRQPRAQAGGLRVLVVEDNEDAARVLKTLLSKDGHEVALTTTGANALELIRSHHPDVVLCDLGLPGLSGFDIARAVREDPALGDVRLVALTGYDRPSDRQETREVGFEAHLAKPATLADLRAILGSGPAGAA